MRLETFIRKSLGMKAHTVVQVEERPGGGLVAHVDRLPGRRLCCGECGRPAAKVATTRRPERRWRDLALRDSRSGWCTPPTGSGVHLRPPGGAGALGGEVAAGHPCPGPGGGHPRPEAGLGAVAAHFRLNWKTVASVVEAAVLWGLAHRRWVPLHVVGIDEVSRRKGQQYLTLVYDLARRRVVWVGKDRDEATLAWLGRGPGDPGRLL